MSRRLTIASVALLLVLPILAASALGAPTAAPGVHFLRRGALLAFEPPTASEDAVYTFHPASGERFALESLPYSRAQTVTGAGAVELSFQTEASVRVNIRADVLVDGQVVSSASLTQQMLSTSARDVFFELPGLNFNIPQGGRVGLAIEVERVPVLGVVSVPGTFYTDLHYDSVAHAGHLRLPLAGENTTVTPHGDPVTFVRGPFPLGLAAAAAALIVGTAAVGLLRRR